jgi:hypothetical protein
MKTHHSPLAAAITLAFALSAAGMSAGAAGPGTTAPAAAPPTATPGAGQMPPLGPWPGAGMNPGQGSMMGPGGGPMWGPGQGPRGRGWGRGMNPQMMQEHWGMMQQRAQAIETHLTNIESLLRELVQLQKGQKTR